MTTATQTQASRTKPDKHVVITPEAHAAARELARIYAGQDPSRLDCPVGEAVSRAVFAELGRNQNPNLAKPEKARSRKRAK